MTITGALYLAPIVISLALVVWVAVRQVKKLANGHNYKGPNQ